MRFRQLQLLGALAEQTAGEPAFARGAVLGARLFAVHEHLVLDALGAPGAAGLVAACLLFPRLLQCALGVAQGIRGAVEVVGGAGAGSLARFGKGRPRAAEYADADRRQFDDAVDAFEQRAVMAGDEDAALPAFEQPRHGLPAVSVEIVGGLVQQQQIRRLDQEARQCDPRSLAAAQGDDRAMQRQRRQPGFGQRCLYSRFQRPIGVGRVFKRPLK